MSRIRVLFVCDAQGLRARVAEHFARDRAGDRIEAVSAAFEPRRIPAEAPPVRALAGLGVKLPSDPVPLVFDLYRQGETFDYVVTMCRDATLNTCPEFQRSVNALFQKKAVSLAWEIDDFRSAQGDQEEVRAASVAIAQDIRGRVARFCKRVVVAGES